MQTVSLTEQVTALCKLFRLLNSMLELLVNHLEDMDTQGVSDIHSSTLEECSMQKNKDEYEYTRIRKQGSFDASSSRYDHFILEGNEQK
jgi:hypothetical protein